VVVFNRIQSPTLMYDPDKLGAVIFHWLSFWSQ
jgi:hypothetical protein